MVTNIPPQANSEPAEPDASEDTIDVTDDDGTRTFAGNAAARKSEKKAGKRKQASSSPAAGGMAKKKTKAGPSSRSERGPKVDHSYLEGEEDLAFQFYDEADELASNQLKQLLLNQLSESRFEHVWPLLLAQEIFKFELLDDVTVEGLQWCGMKLGAATAIKQVVHEVQERGAQVAKNATTLKEDGEEDDAPTELHIFEQSAEEAEASAGGAAAAEEETAALEQVLRQSCAAAQFQKRWVLLQEEMVTDVKVLQDITALQLQKIGLPAGAAAAIVQAVRNM
jgi:hypothetical protein